MRFILSLLVFISFFSLALAENRYEKVIVVSIDALHPDAVSAKNCPNIFERMKKGTFTLKGTSTTPPKTLIAHTALLTGLPPKENGKMDNLWKPGEPKVGVSTMFETFKKKGYETSYLYSKKKLGFLADSNVDKEIFSAEDSISKAGELVMKDKEQFIFLHISGLDRVGPKNGWLSPEYIEEFFYIDEELGEFLNKVEKAKSYLVIITSDHAGHEKIHASMHPEDFKRPLVAYSSKFILQYLPENVVKPEALRGYLESLAF